MKEDLNQGDIIKVEKIGKPVLIVSKDFFNLTGEVIACPIFEDGKSGPLHIKIRSNEIVGNVHCEKLKLLDLNSRGYSKIDRLQISDIMDITDAIQGIFDYI